MHFFRTGFGLYGFLGGSDREESAYNAGDLSLIPGPERSPGEGNSIPLQYSCLQNSMNRGAWWATVHGVTKSQTRLQQPSMHTFLKKAEKATQSKTTIIFAHQTGTLKI